MMKKIKNCTLYIVSLCMIVLFAACSDVPMPYDEPQPQKKITPTGNGTKESPYNVAALDSLFDNSIIPEEKVYARGIISRIDELDTSYGNATYYISDTGNETSQFEVYRGYGLNGEKFKTGDEIQKGDTVVVYGQLLLHGTTREFTQGSSIISINGGGGPTPSPIDPKGSGTADDPYNIAKLLQLFAQDNIPTEKIYFKGIVANIKELDTGNFGNATYYVSDTGENTNTFYVYRSYYLNNEKFTSTDQLQVGDTVIVYGNVTLYKSTPETVQNESHLYWISRGVGPGPGPTPGPEGSGTYDDPFTIAGAQANQGVKGYVKGYIVGFVTGQVLASGATFSAEGAVASNILIAKSADETNVNNCIPVQLVGGSPVRAGINLMDNAGMYKKELLIYGSLEKYFGAAGLKTTTYAECDGKTFGTKPGDTPPPSTDVWAMDFKAKGSKGDWTIEDKSLDPALSYVWTFDSKYGMKASAYISKCLASESWLISPAINLPAGVKTLSIHEAMNQLKGGNRADHVNVMVSTDKTNWSEVHMSGWPAGTDWNFGDYTADFSAYAGKTIYIAFKYKSTENCAPTWEVEKLSIN